MKSMNSWAGFLVCVAISTVATISIDDCPGNPQLDRYLRAFGDSCYEFVLDHTREWPTAESECRRRNGHLAVIRDAATNQFLHDTLQELMLYDGMVFIGLTDSDTEGHWVWVDGSEASYTNWAPDRPSDASSTENCAAINSGDGLWHDYFCESALFFHNDNKFICEYPIETRNATTAEAPTQTGITTTTTDVVTPTEVPTTDFLTTGVPATSELPPTTTIVAGDTPCPLFQCALDCGLNGYDVTDMGYVLPIWAKAEDTATIDDCPANLERDRFLRVFRDSCYEFVLDHEREWPTAEFECGHKGGHLVIIRDAATNEWIYNTLKVEFRFDDVVFIGLTDSASEGHWLWVDDSRAFYTNWASDQPGFAGALEDCVTMDASDGKWHDHYCEDVLFVQNDEAFICQYPIVKQAPVTTEESPLESTQ